MVRTGLMLLVLLSGIGMVAPASAGDVEGVQEPGVITRYPGQEIRWQQIENDTPFRVPAGEVAGYQSTSDWIDAEGRVTRTYYNYQGTARTFAEFYLNYLRALQEQDFEILGKGVSGSRSGVGVGSRNWTKAYAMANPVSTPGEIDAFFATTSSSGGAGAIVARKVRDAGTVYVVIGVEQHSQDEVGTLIDIIEVGTAETGLDMLDSEAMGAALQAYGRVVLAGIVFDSGKVTVKAESDPALEVIAGYLKDNPEKTFYVVGHTDSLDTFAANSQLSTDRAAAVVAVLEARFGIAAGSLEPHGVGPLSPVISHGQESSEQESGRVELVAR